MALILDLSNNNPDPNWAQVKSHGVHAVYLKASEGLHFVDRTYASRRKEALRHGLAVGAYHFARPDSDAIEQARALVKAIGGKLGARDCRPALDFETPSLAKTGAQMVEWARTFNHEVRRLVGLYPLFYSYSAFITGMHAKAPIGSGLWLANYSRNDGKEHPVTVPAPWKKITAHQFSSRCSVGGCTGLVDLSHAVSLVSLLAHPPPRAVR